MDFLGIPLVKVLLKPKHLLLQEVNRQDHRASIHITFQILGGLSLLYLLIVLDYDLGQSIGDLLVIDVLTQVRFVPDFELIYLQELLIIPPYIDLVSKTKLFDFEFEEDIFEM